jgi:hypothetical protein
MLISQGRGGIAARKFHSNVKPRMVSLARKGFGFVVFFI